MLDPVVAADGHSYERASILMWLEAHDTSPLTGAGQPCITHSRRDQHV